MAQYEKRGYLLENFRLFHLRSQGSTKVDFHYHEFCKILLLVSGQGSYFVDGKRYQLSPGDIVLIGSRSVHKPEFLEGSAYERIIIYVSPEYLQKMSTPDCDLRSVFSGEMGRTPSSLYLTSVRQSLEMAGAASLNAGFCRAATSSSSVPHSSS